MGVAVKAKAALLRSRLAAFVRKMKGAAPEGDPDTGLLARAQEKMSARDAVALITAAGRANCKVLGVDGFQIVPEGHLASLDLILDLSTRPMTRAAAAETAIAFITARSTSDMLFEVVIERVDVARLARDAQAGSTPGR
ncbi:MULTISPECIES: hypothetical protein [unclassified Sphingobium]|uniref:hypothetical protein n=1 Tax=unclassified Sphingobium TaxID=2611147 RepID=UPI002224370A|nr:MULTISPECIES: hypothetical protein [unclassified Sphingobium]MCW2410583.1 hypothetical protein [Sphingobium sp. B8D3D]MCW2413724.1 hypothetical protein [Sphingobium sp. B8D3A]